MDEKGNLLRELGNRIYDRRKQLRMTQETLAEAAGITPQTVSAAELGKKALRPENIINICAALDVSPDYLRRILLTASSPWCSRLKRMALRTVCALDGAKQVS